MRELPVVLGSRRWCPASASADVVAALRASATMRAAIAIASFMVLATAAALGPAAALAAGASASMRRRPGRLRRRSIWPAAAPGAAPEWSLKNFSQVRLADNPSPPAPPR